MLYPITEIANFNCIKEKAVKKNAHACRVYPLPGKGIIDMR